MYENLITIRIKTLEEFKEEGLLDTETGTPIGWNSKNAMDYLYGKIYQIPIKYFRQKEPGNFISHCFPDSEGQYSRIAWTISPNDYIILSTKSYENYEAY